MDENEEEFYDSLDEDQSYEEILEEKFCTPLNNISKCEIPETESTQNKYEKTPENETKKSIRTKIPLYIGEIDKDDIKILKKNKQNITCTRKDSSSCLSCDTMNKQKTKSDNAAKRKADNSYWQIHCQKNGVTLFGNVKDCDGFRNLFENTKKFSNILNSSSCLTGSTWDAPSVFEKYIPKKYGANKNELPTYDEEDIDNSTITKYTETEVDVENLKSVSQHELVKPVSSKTCKVAKSRSNTSNVSFRPLSLKWLGPDTGKLDMLRKQQEYGIKASSRNRARIIQNLSKLRQEVNEEKKNS